MRERVRQIFGDLDAILPNPQNPRPPNRRALELNCGTGEDAVWLAKQGWQVLATDISPEMVAVARAKVAAQLSKSWQLSESSATKERIQFQTCSFSEISRFAGTQFDLIFSNFGGLNCASPGELKKLSLDLQKLITPGGTFVAVVMSRFCWWETLYFLLKMKPREAFRRLNREPVNARLDEKTTVSTWYYSPKEFQRLFPDFQVKQVYPTGFWLPPSYLNPFFEKHPRLLSFLNFLEKKCAPAWLAPAADHFFICLKKTNNQQPENSNQQP